MTTVIWIVYGILLAYFTVLGLIQVGLLVGGLRQNWIGSQQARHTEFGRLASSAATIPVSVIVPAFNEEIVIRDCVLSILGSDYAEFELIVVNDGSTDRTLEVLREEFSLDLCDRFRPLPLHTQPVRGVYRSDRIPNLLVIDKLNGGQADAVNAGINHAQYRYLLHTDSDCVLEPDTLLRTIRPAVFDPGTVIAMAGQLRPANGLVVRDGAIIKRRVPRRLIERFQTVEYLSAFVTNRIAWSAINGSPVVAGGFGAWRRDAVLDLGGQAIDTTHQDIEMTIHAHEYFRRKRLPHRLMTVPDAVIWTQVPATWRDLFNQRKRWQRVVYEVVWKYRRMLFRPRYGTVGLVTMPYLLLYEALGPFVEVFAYAFTGALAVLGILDWRALLVFLAFSVSFTALIRLASLLRDVVLFDMYSVREVGTLALVALVEPIAYRLVLLPVRIYAFIEFLKGRQTHEQLSRSTLTAQPAET